VKRPSSPRQLVSKDDSGGYRWRATTRTEGFALVLDLADGKARGRKTPIGILPEASELDLQGLEHRAGRPRLPLRYDPDEWRREMDSRDAHLSSSSACRRRSSKPNQMAAAVRGAR
jgi:GTP-dependent phosphoenolpyruvate carboxykinase